MELRNKVALIAGGSSGIGAAIARKFASEGATCAIVASSNVQKANKIAREIKRKSKGYVCDVTKPAEVAKLVEKELKDHKKIDILVNSAGIFVPTPAGATKTSDLDEMIDVNLKGTLHMINAVVPHMRARKRGNIINMASAASPRHASVSAFRGEGIVQGCRLWNRGEILRRRKPGNGYLAGGVTIFSPS